MVVSEGFKYNLKHGRSRLPDIFDYFTEKPEPLVARRHVREIGERMLKTGVTYKALPEAEVIQAVKGQIADGVGAGSRSVPPSDKAPATDAKTAELIPRDVPPVCASGSARSWAPS